jgi:hypothetical protein
VVPLGLTEIEGRNSRFIDNQKITDEDILQILEYMQEASYSDRLFDAVGRGRDEMKSVTDEIYRLNVPEYAQRQLKPLQEERSRHTNLDNQTESNTNVRTNTVKRDMLRKEASGLNTIITYEKRQASIKRIFNAYNKFGDTILHVYVKELNVDAASFFLENNTDPLKENKDGLKPSQILTKLSDLLDESDKRYGDAVILQEKLKAWGTQRLTIIQYSTY